MSRTRKSGLPPGTVIYTGKTKKEQKIPIDIIDYTGSSYQEKRLKAVEECFRFKQSRTVTWININGIHQPEMIEKIGKFFDIHPLVLEDIANPSQRPKIDYYDQYVFIVLKMLQWNKEEVEAEQISMIVRPGLVISFQEKEGDVFKPIRDRLKNPKSRIRKTGSDYLSYALIDAIVDNYFSILETIGEHTEALEEKVMHDPQPKTLSKIHKMKQDLIFIRRSVWPLREVIGTLLREESKFITKPTRIYFRDVYDHTIQVMDSVDTFRDMVSGMMDVYLSSLSNRMNEVMKVLTVIATIFIPLTFITGVYGMNFQHMPELAIKTAYPIVWAVMIALGLGMFLYFRTKRWL